MGLRLAVALQALVMDGIGVLGRSGRSERGQGTVEYVALIMLVAVVLAGVVAATKQAGDGGIGKAIVDQLKSAIARTAGAG